MSNCKDPSQPFPSPGSAFIPPPVPGPHEFASPPRRMSRKDVEDAVQDARKATACNGNTTPTAINGPVALSSRPTPNGVDHDPCVLSAPPEPSLPTHDPPDAHPHDPSAPPDPRLSLPSTSNHTHHRLSTQSVTSLTSSRPAPPSPAVSRRASGLSRASSRPVSGMSSSSASSRPASGVQYSRPMSGTGSRPISAIVQLPTSTTPTAATPTTSALPRHISSNRPVSLSALPTTAEIDTTLTEPTSTPQPTPTAATAPALIRIRDYGFAPTDPRFTGQGPHVPRVNRPTFLARRLASVLGSSNDDEDDEDDEGGEKDRILAQSMWEDVDDGSNGWGGFNWGLGRAWAFPKGDTGVHPSSLGFPSRGDLDRNFGPDDEWEDMVDEDGEQFSDDDTDAEGEPPLFPGLYRALYAFEPEGTAEMKLDEDQLVRVIGRGGGVGWAVVVKDGLKDTGMHALVPESYLEPVRLDGEEEEA